MKYLAVSGIIGQRKDHQPEMRVFITKLRLIQGSSGTECLSLPIDPLVHEDLRSQLDRINTIDSTHVEASRQDTDTLNTYANPGRFDIQRSPSPDEDGPNTDISNAYGREHTQLRQNCPSIGSSRKPPIVYSGWQRYRRPKIC